MGDPERIRRFVEAVRGTPPEKLVDGGLQLLRELNIDLCSRLRAPKWRGARGCCSPTATSWPPAAWSCAATSTCSWPASRPASRPAASTWASMPSRSPATWSARPPDRRGPAALPDPVLDRDPLPGSATVQRRRRPPARRRHRDPPPDADQAVLPGDAIPGARRALPAKHRPRLAEHHAALRPSRGPVRQRHRALQESRPRSDGTSTIVPRPCGHVRPGDVFASGGRQALPDRVPRDRRSVPRSARGRRSTRRGSSTIAAT